MEILNITKLDQSKGSYYDKQALYGFGENLDVENLLLTAYIKHTNKKFLIIYERNKEIGISILEKILISVDAEFGFQSEIQEFGSRWEQEFAKAVTQ